MVVHEGRCAVGADGLCWNIPANVITDKGLSHVSGPLYQLVSSSEKCLKEQGNRRFGAM